VRAPIDRVLLAALVDSLAAASRQTAWWIDVEGHGRDLALPGMDLARTVGWFTSIYPVRFDAATHDASSPRWIVSTPRCARSRPAASGWAWPEPAAHPRRLRRCVRCPTAASSSITSAASTNRPPGDLGGTRAPERHRTHPVAVEAAVVQGRLDVGLSASPARSSIR
jgi:hypothetical protein